MDYPTRPVQCWGKAIELRRKHRWHTFNAQREGQLLVHGMPYFPSLLAGMGNFGCTEFTPNFRVIMEDPAMNIKCCEAAEARGFSRDMCSSMRVHLGAYFLGFALTSRQGENIKPDFVFQAHECVSLAKTGQLYGELLGIPYLAIDIPWKDSPTAQRSCVAQLHEAIEWLEKVTGRRYDDGLLLEAVRNEWENLSLFARILYLCKAMPAPLDGKQLFTLNIPVTFGRHEREVVEFTRELLAEVEDRVKEGISAKGYERCRLSHSGFYPHYYPKILSYPNVYGAIYIASDHLWTLAGWSTLDLEAANWVPLPPTPEEAGYPLRNREDALNLLYYLYVRHRPHTCPVEMTAVQHVKMALNWKIGGAVFHADRGCKGLQAGIMEGKLALEKIGIPTIIYEASGYDPRDLDEASVLDRLDGFFADTLGLNRVTTE